MILPIPYRTNQPCSSSFLYIHDTIATLTCLKYNIASSYTHCLANKQYTNEIAVFAFVLLICLQIICFEQTANHFDFHH